MPTELTDLLRDVIVLAYMFVLRLGVPLLVTLMLGKWIQRKLAERDLAEHRALHGEPYCWELRRTPTTATAKRATAAHPDLPCWLAVQTGGGGLTRDCYDCKRYALGETRKARRLVEE